MSPNSLIDCAAPMLAPSSFFCPRELMSASQFAAARGGLQIKENLHEWRKSTKDFGCQARLLSRACPAFMEELAHDLKVLTEFVGEEHDFAGLRKALGARRKAIKRPRQLETFCKLIDLRRHELVCAALDLGEHLFSQAPKDFARELDHQRDARQSLVCKKKKLVSSLVPPA